MRSHYKQAMDSLALSPEASMRIRTSLYRPKRRIGFRPAAIAAAAVLLLALCTTAAASGIFYHDIPAAIAQSLEPVRLSSASQGITMTVQSATVEDGVFTAYITMRDELDSGRLAQGVDFYDSYRINTPYRASMVSYFYQSLGYDENSGSYGFLVRIEAEDDQERTLDFTNDKFTFSVGQLLLGQVKSEPVLAPDWDSIPEKPLTVRKYIFGRNVKEGKKLPLAEDGTALILQPGTLDIPVVGGVAITAAGFLDGLFRLQLHFDNGGPDDHGWLALVGPDGERLADCGAMYTREEDGGKYIETLYDITREDLSGCTLAGEFTTGGYLLNGDWKVTFTLQDGA